MTRGGTYYTLRCYLDDQPDLPRPQRPHQRVRVRAVAGALPRRRARERPVRISPPTTTSRPPPPTARCEIEVTDDNVYVLSGPRRRPRRRPRGRRPRPAGTGRRVDSGTSATTPRTAPSTTRSTPTSRSAGSSRTCWTPTRSASPPRRTPRPSRSGRSWRPSSSRGCARSDEFRADGGSTHP